MRTRALIVTGYGINAQDELAVAFEKAGAFAGVQHIQNVIECPDILLKADFLGFPGGFSFGDHLGSGRVLANLLVLKLRPVLREFIARGGLVIGICNGFQVLVKTGFLPGTSVLSDGNDCKEGSYYNDNSGRTTGDHEVFKASADTSPMNEEGCEPQVSLIHNQNGTFIDTWVDVEFPENSRCVWTRGLAPRLLPIRHGEGRFVACDAVLDALEQKGMVAVRYTSNPNGSMRDIAGICDWTGRVFGLMPHPEASIYPEVHPERRRSNENLLGLDIFANAVAFREEMIDTKVI